MLHLLRADGAETTLAEDSFLPLLTDDGSDPDVALLVTYSGPGRGPRSASAKALLTASSGRWVHGSRPL